jgi:hypothetical protein
MRDTKQTEAPGPEQEWLLRCSVVLVL